MFFWGLAALLSSVMAGTVLAPLARQPQTKIFAMGLTVLLPLLAVGLYLCFGNPAFAG